MVFFVGDSLIYVLAYGSSQVFEFPLYSLFLLIDVENTYCLSYRVRWYSPHRYKGPCMVSARLPQGMEFSVLRAKKCGRTRLQGELRAQLPHPFF